MSENGGRTFFDPDQYGKRRDDSNGFWGKAAAYGMKYNWLVTLFFAIFLLLGFGFKTPRDAFAELGAAIEAVKKTAAENKAIADEGLDSLSRAVERGARERQELKTLVEGSVIAQCKSLPRSATQYLPCKRLYREWGIE